MALRRQNLSYIFDLIIIRIYAECLQSKGIHLWVVRTVCRSPAMRQWVGFPPSLFWKHWWAQNRLLPVSMVSWTLRPRSVTRAFNKGHRGLSESPQARSAWRHWRSAVPHWQWHSKERPLLISRRRLGPSIDRIALIYMYSCYKIHIQCHLLSSPFIVHWHSQSRNLPSHFPPPLIIRTEKREMKSRFDLIFISKKKKHDRRE